MSASPEEHPTTESKAEHAEEHGTKHDEPKEGKKKKGLWKKFKDGAAKVGDSVQEAIKPLEDKVNHATASANHSVDKGVKSGNDEIHKEKKHHKDKKAQKDKDDNKEKHPEEHKEAHGDEEKSAPASETPAPAPTAEHHEIAHSSAPYPRRASI
jgi:hypothetical protein